MLDIARHRRKTLKKKKENRKMRKSQTTTTNIFLLLFFHIKHIWKNLVWVVAVVLQIYRVAVYWKCSNRKPTSVQIDMYWFYRRRTSTQNTWHRFWYQWIIASSFMFQRSTFNLEKSKSICSESFLVEHIQVTGSTYCRIVFQTMHISKICP